jgi:hypothetical protein
MVVNINGNWVQLIDLRVDGLDSDGTARPGADLIFFVTYPPEESGCGINGETSCYPGARIQWFVDGVQVQDNPNTAYQASFASAIGAASAYISTWRLIAPQTGSVTVTAKSANTLTLTVRVTETSSLIGSVRAEDIGFGDLRTSDDNGCNAGHLRVWWTNIPIAIGNGTSYVSIAVNGAIVENKALASVYGGRASWDIPCPPTGSVVSVTGSGGGDSGSVGAGGDGGGDVGGDGGGYGGDGGGYGGDGGGYGGGTDIISSIKTFYEDNKIMTIGGVIVIGALLLLGSSGGD